MTLLIFLFVLSSARGREYGREENLEVMRDTVEEREEGLADRQKEETGRKGAESTREK